MSLATSAELGFFKRNFRLLTECLCEVTSVVMVNGQLCLICCAGPMFRLVTTVFMSKVNVEVIGLIFLRLLLLIYYQ